MFTGHSIFHAQQLTREQAFLLTNTALSGFPLFLFILFGLTIFTFSLIVALIVGLVIAVLFSLSAIGIALMFLFPIIFFTTLTACFIFLMGLAGYWIFKKFNQGGPGNPGDAIGDKLNSLTGGRLDFFMGQARESLSEKRLGNEPQKIWSHGPSGYYGDKEHTPKQIGEAKKEHAANGSTDGHADGEANGQTNGHTNGTPKKAAADKSKATTSGSDAKSHATNAADGVRKNIGTEGVNNVTNQASKAPVAGGAANTVKSTPKKLNNATGNVKMATGVVGGASGLT